MNRTIAYLSIAAALVLIAVVVGLPHKTSTPPPQPIPVTTPTPTPPPPQPPPPPAQAPGSLTLTGSLSHPQVAPGTTTVFASLEISAVELPATKRAPVNLALVIDRSGSMSGRKIADARRAAQRLVELLNADDRLAVIDYGSDINVFPGTFATDENKARMRRYIGNIQEVGGTNIGDGLEAGRRQIEKAMTDFRVNRILLLSDGQPTVGITSARGLENLVTAIRNKNVSVTALGVGADFNEDLMQQLAARGGGSFGFISEGDGALMARIFEKDLTQAGTLVAQSTSLTITAPAGTTIEEVFGRSSTRSGDSVTVSLPDFSAGQHEKLVVRLTVNAASGSVGAGQFELNYRDLLADRAASNLVSLSAMVNTDLAAVKQARNKDAIVFATRAQAASNTRAAAEALAGGRMREAQQALKQNEVLFDEAATVAGDDAFKADKMNNDSAFEATNAPAAPEPVRREKAKAMKVQSMRDEGYGASVY